LRNYHNNMSDGNFNRALLPHTPYASGMKAGKQIAKMKAVEVFKAQLIKLCPTLDEESIKHETEIFEHELSSKL